MKSFSKKKLFITISFCYLFSLSFFLGATLSVNKSITAKQLGSDLLQAIIPGVLILFLHFLLKKLCCPKYFFVNSKMELCFSEKKDIAYCLICLLSHFLAWLPLLLAYYPGLMNYDASAQINQHMGTYSTPHPLFHTFYLKFFYNIIGEKLFHNVNIGVLLATITQMILLSAMISYMHLFLKRLGLRIWYRILALLFTCFAPFISGMSISLVKDTLFSGLFLVIFICLCYWELDSKGYCSSKKYILIYISAITAICLTRKNGILTVSIILLVEAFMLIQKEKRKAKIKLLTYTLIGIGIFFILQSSAIFVTKASGSSSNEILSIPYQQLAYVNNVMREEITIEEQEALYTILPDIEKYNLRNSDPIKARAQGMENFECFISIYFKLACRFPIQYAEAFLHHTIGYWYIYDASFSQFYGVSSRIGYLPTLQCELGIEEQCFLPIVFHYFDSLFSYNNYQNNILLFTICSPSTYLWIIAMFFIWNLENKKNKFVLPFVFIFSLVIPLFLGPCVLVRYVLPYILCVPALCAIVIGKRE